MQIAPVKNDNYFHELFHKHNMHVIEWIVMQILNLNYDDVKYKCNVIDSRLARTNKKVKNKYVDFIITYQEYYIILELNNNFLGNSARNIIYGMTTIVNHYGLETDIKVDDKIIKTIVVNLNWHKYKSNAINERIEDIHAYERIQKGPFFEVININLDKYATIDYNLIDTNEKFYKLLTIDNKDDLLEFTKDEPLLKEYVDRIIQLNEGSDEIMTETMEENILRAVSYEYGFDEGEKKGISQGIAKKETDVVENMYKENMNINLISKIANIPISKVKEIINNIKTKEQAS